MLQHLFPFESLSLSDVSRTFRERDVHQLSRPFLPVMRTKKLVKTFFKRIYCRNKTSLNEKLITLQRLICFYGLFDGKATLGLPFCNVSIFNQGALLEILLPLSGLCGQ